MRTRTSGEVLDTIDTVGRHGRGVLHFATEPSELGNAIESYSPTATKGIGEVESIVIAIGRPVLLVQHNTFKLTGLPSDRTSQFWGRRLDKAKHLLDAAIPSVGRINLRNHPRFKWVATGWLVAGDIVVTNSHVALEFAMKDPSGRGYKFRTNSQGRPIAASIDFRMELGTVDVNEFPLTDVLYIAEDNAPDVALFRLSTAGASAEAALPGPIALSKAAVSAKQQLAVIGYPAYDSRIDDPEVVRNIFGDIYDVKRLATGQIMRIDAGVLEHDASTLGGNSGSCVIDLATGHAVGLHYAGDYGQANYAVPASAVLDRLSSLS